MKTTPRLMALVAAALLVSGFAGGSSLHAQAQGRYTGGIIAAPTDADVQEAIALGTASKDNLKLETAYSIKAPRFFDAIFVKVATPLYLIGSHAKEQAQNFRKPDDAFIQYARNIRAVRFSMVQAEVTRGLTVLAFQREVMLLRDGIRVEPLAEIPAWAGQNPFADKPNKQMQAVVAQVQKTAAQYSRSYVASMTKEQKERLLKSYRTMGMSEDQIVAYTGLSRDEIRELSVSSVSGNAGKISLTEFDAVFAVDELLKPGKYEIVFRTPPRNYLIDRGDKEIRFPISFSNIR